MSIRHDTIRRGLSILAGGLLCGIGIVLVAGAVLADPGIGKVALAGSGLACSAIGYELI